MKSICLKRMLPPGVVYGDTYIYIISQHSNPRANFEYWRCKLINHFRDVWPMQAK